MIERRAGFPGRARKGAFSVQYCTDFAVWLFVCRSKHDSRATLRLSAGRHWFFCDFCSHDGTMKGIRILARGCICHRAVHDGHAVSARTVERLRNPQTLAVSDFAEGKRQLSEAGAA